MVLLDLGLPDLDGTEVIAGLRAWTNVPILVLSGRSDSTDKVDALDAGADDYVTKPFGDGRAAGPAARWSAAGGRRESPRSTFGDIVVDLGATRVTRRGEEVRLTPTEWHLLAGARAPPGQAAQPAPAADRGVGTRLRDRQGNLRLYMAQLRRKLEPNPSRPRYLLTEPGMGYRFQP